MKFSQSCVQHAIRVFVPDVAASKKAIPEALAMAAVESFLLNGQNYTDEKRLAEAIIRMGLQEVREKGSISFGFVEWELPAKKAKSS